MEESFERFKSLTEISSIERLLWIVLLNKVDIFEKKIKEVPVSAKYPTFDGGEDCTRACEYFADQFARHDKRSDGELTLYVTSAVDRATFEKTLQTIKPILTRNGRKHSSSSERAPKSGNASTRSDGPTKQRAAFESMGDNTFPYLDESSWRTRNLRFPEWKNTEKHHSTKLIISKKVDMHVDVEEALTVESLGDTYS